MHMTIDIEEQVGGTWFYRLRYPNHEVYQSLNAALLDTWTSDSQASIRNRRSLHRLLLVNDFAGLEQLFTAFFASIPTDWCRRLPGPSDWRRIQP